MILAALLVVADVFVTGRAVDEARRPSPGAEIEAQLPDGRSIRTTAHEDGRFSLALPAPDRLRRFAALLGRDATGRVGALTVPLRADDDARDVGLFVIRPALALAAFARPGTLVRTRTGSLGPWVGAAVTEAGGWTHLAGLPPGPLELVADRYARAATWLPDPAGVALEPAAPRETWVEVRDEASRAPLADARVSAWELVGPPAFPVHRLLAEALPTSPEGRTHFSLPPDVPVLFVARARGFAEGSGTMPRLLLRPGEKESGTHSSAAERVPDPFSPPDLEAPDRRLIVRVRPPRDLHFALVLEQRSRLGPWLAEHEPGPRPLAPPFLYLFESLRPGPALLRDRVSGRRAGPIEIFERATSTVVDLDLSR